MILINYDYKCNNFKCENFNQITTITKPITDCSIVEICKYCGGLLDRTIESFGSSYQVNCTGFYGKKSV